jgi:hypothetical protein
MRASHESGLPAAILQIGQVAQLVEQGIENPRVGGSIPSLATISPAPLYNRSALPAGRPRCRAPRS